MHKWSEVKGHCDKPFWPNSLMYLKEPRGCSTSLTAEFVCAAVHPETHF